MIADIAGKSTPSKQTTPDIQQTTPEIQQASTVYDNTYVSSSSSNGNRTSREILCDSPPLNGCYGDEKGADVLLSDDKERPNAIEIGKITSSSTVSNLRILPLPTYTASSQTTDSTTRAIDSSIRQPRHNVQHEQIAVVDYQTEISRHVTETPGVVLPCRPNDVRHQNKTPRDSPHQHKGHGQMIVIDNPGMHKHLNTSGRLQYHGIYQTQQKGVNHYRKVAEYHKHQDDDGTSPKPLNYDTEHREESSSVRYSKTSGVFIVSGQNTPRNTESICPEFPEQRLSFVNQKIYPLNDARQYDVRYHHGDFNNTYKNVTSNANTSVSEMTQFQCRNDSEIREHTKGTQSYFQQRAEIRRRGNGEINEIRQHYIQQREENSDAFPTLLNNGVRVPIAAFTTQTSRDCNDDDNDAKKFVPQPRKQDRHEDSIYDTPCKSPRLSLGHSMVYSQEPQFQLQDPPKSKLFKRQLLTTETARNITDVYKKENARLRSTEDMLVQTSIQSPHIRKSSVIKTPTKKAGHVFVFPEIANTSQQQMDYRFEVNSNHVPTFGVAMDNKNDSSTTPSEPFNMHGPYRLENGRIPESMHHSPLRTPTKCPHCVQMSSRGYHNQSISPEKRRPLRSQSNIEESPSKRSEEEMAAIKYNRSISQPVHHNDGCYNIVHNHQIRAADFEKMGEEYDVNDLVCKQIPRDQLQRNARYKTDVEELMPEEYDLLVIPRTSNDLRSWSRRNSPRVPKPVSIPLSNSCSNDRQRAPGDIEIKIQCSDVAKQCKDVRNRLQHLNRATDNNCECNRIENEILQMAFDAYKKVENRTQLAETNKSIADAMHLVVRLQELCGHGRTVKNICNGSVIIRMNCSTLTSLEDLWMKYLSGELLGLIYKMFISPEFLEKCQAKFIFLRVTVLKSEYEICQQELGCGLAVETPTPKREVKQIKTSPLKRSPDKRVFKSADDLLSIPLSPKSAFKTISSSTPVLMRHSPQNSPNSPRTYYRRERQFSFSSVDDQSPRRVFQEINTPSPRSPGKKFNLDDLLQFIDDSIEDDQENVSSNMQSPGARHKQVLSPDTRYTASSTYPLSPTKNSPRHSPR
ncbi:uncharacterized protein LOC126816702 [Patella vulgata]|uniref:uncharacterized protein LOC126816702 n=1 Tax=Patella vulgata TaxID=6465 RepID=UPI00217F9102|nr:uncharacterized protein LOC126816702 [Patella vulgata]